MMGLGGRWLPGLQYVPSPLARTDNFSLQSKEIPSWQSMQTCMLDENTGCTPVSVIPASPLMLARHLLTCLSWRKGYCQHGFLPSLSTHADHPHHQRAGAIWNHCNCVLHYHQPWAHCACGAKFQNIFCHRATQVSDLLNTPVPVPPHTASLPARGIKCIRSSSPGYTKPQRRQGADEFFKEYLCLV